ncbi:MAG: RimK family alpha-L-glutamate ligase [Lachnospiraceae bacterium]|nr:RimK family alpha-L-glutamate ligase [Lachnospiraceae bacterium]
MPISGYIIEKYNQMTNAYTCNRLVEEAANLGIDLKIVGIHDTIISENGLINNGTKLEKREFVINRYKWGKVKDEINSIAIKSYNPLDAYNIYINKYEQVKKLCSDEFLVPKYLLGTALLKYEDIVQILGTPFVAKGLESSMGEQISLIEKPEDLQNLSRTYGMEKEWLFEEFITNSFGRDMRFYSIRGEVVACMQRKSQGDFRANVALGASVEPFEITPQIRQIAKDIYNQTGLDFLGIDLLFGKDKPYFCEINVMPGIEGIETATGVNVAKKIIETIYKDFI